MARQPDEPARQDRPAPGTARTETGTAPAAAPAETDPGRPTGRDRRVRGAGRAALWRRAVELTASAVLTLSAVAAVTMALEITFKVFKANTGNAIVRFVGTWADWLSWEFRDLFTPADPRVEVLVNFGLAGIAYLVGGRLLARLIRKAG